jgi:hypothetical protein
MKIKISDSAYRDIESGQLFYERQEEGLGIYFQDSLFSDIDSLLFYAGIHLIQYGKHRLLSKKFPYAIYYQIENGLIVVSAVLDCRRNPKWIKNKLK